MAVDRLVGTLGPADVTIVALTPAKGVDPAVIPFLERAGGIVGRPRDGAQGGLLGGLQ